MLTKKEIKATKDNIYTDQSLWKNRKRIFQMKKIGISLFVISLLIPSVGMLFGSESVSENRTLSRKPELVDASGNLNLDFFKEAENYVSDHFFGRGALLEADSEVKQKLFESPMDDQVILGKEGWLFFDRTIPEYIGQSMNEEEIKLLSDKMEEITRQFQEVDKQLIFMLIPNKNIIYSEYMPEKYGDICEKNNYSMFLEEIKTRNVTAIDLKSLYLEQKEKNRLYHKLDTHWNNTGALLALNELYKVSGIDEHYDVDSYYIEVSHEPDLEKIIHPQKYQLDEQHIYDIPIAYESEKRIRDMDEALIETYSENGNGHRLYMYRDSFGRAIIPYLSTSFNQAIYTRNIPYDLNMALESDCDIVVVEIAERNIQDLLNMCY